jgi:hypothetical protein
MIRGIIFKLLKRINCLRIKFFYFIYLQNKTLKNSFQTVKIPLEIINKTKSSPSISRVFKQRIFKSKIFSIQKAGLIEEIDWACHSNDINYLREIDVFEQRINKNVNWEDTIYYKSFTENLSKKGYGRGRTKSWEEYKLKFLNKWDRLISDIQSNGYKTQAELNKFNCIPSEIQIAISKDREFIFLDGRHRFSIAKALKLEKIPVIINIVHPQLFYDFNLDPLNTTPAQLIKKLLN